MLYVSLLQLLRVQSIKAADVQTVLATVPPSDRQQRDEISQAYPQSEALL